jgi:hypothetical protein
VIDTKQKKKKAKLVSKLETRLLVWGMAFATTEKDIRHFFTGKGKLGFFFPQICEICRIGFCVHSLGEIKSVELFRDQRGQPAGSALVEFETCAQALEAEKMAGKKILSTFSSDFVYFLIFNFCSFNFFFNFSSFVFSLIE